MSEVMVIAHVKWFYEGEELALRWDLFFQPLPLIFCGAALLLTLIGWLLWKWRKKVEFIPGPKGFGATPEGIKKFYELIPLILAVHLVIPLIVMGVMGRLLSFNNPLDPGWAHFLGLAQVFLAIALLYGAFTRVCACGIIILWILGLFLVGVESMLDNIYILGLALFFFFAGRGRYAFDRYLFPRCEPRPCHSLLSILSLRLGVGLSLLVIGFTEKFLNIPLSMNFLHDYPILNFTHAVFFPMSDEIFVLFIGAVEVFVGLMLIFGIFPRLIIIAALIPMNLTLMVFTWSELIGHLPFYASLAVLLIWSPTKENQQLFQEGVYN